jgi:hypothetical protein
MKRNKRTPAKPVVTVSLEKDLDIDWTPATARVHPRVVTVKQGKLYASVAEAWLSHGQGKGGSFIFIVGVGDGTGEVRDNLFGEEFSPDDLDLFISLLGLARDKARALGMPSKQRDGAAA